MTNSGNSTNSGEPAEKRYRSQKKGRRSQIILLASFIGLVIMMVLIGTVAGFASGRTARETTENGLLASAVQEQFQLGQIDLAEGRYEIARQRFEYVISQDPDYPGAAESLAELLLYLFATATPSPLPPTVTPLPTEDPRPVQELFVQAEAFLANRDWQHAIETLISLRKEDTSYRTARVDGMLYLALRYRGVQKILELGNLQGGMYDLSLAENIGPLDIESEKVRGWARLYIIGSSFWEVYPEQAVNYFSQVASAAPYLRDSSGWTAIDRYRSSLIHYGDQFASNEDWCAAQAQYEAAYSIRADEDLYAKIEQAAMRCAPATETATLITVTSTITGTVTTTVTYLWTPTVTPSTPTPSPTISIPTLLPSQTPSPTIPVPPTPTQTPMPTTPPLPSPTPTSSPTEQPPENSTPNP